MNINCRRFRLSTYQEHKVMGVRPKRRIAFAHYRSGDNGGRQMNYSLTLGLTTWHLKVRYQTPVERERQATADLLKATDAWCERQARGTNQSKEQSRT